MQGQNSRILERSGDLVIGESGTWNPIQEISLGQRHCSRKQTRPGLPGALQVISRDLALLLGFIFENLDGAVKLLILFGLNLLGLV